METEEAKPKKRVYVRCQTDLMLLKKVAKDILNNLEAMLKLPNEETTLAQYQDMLLGKVSVVTVLSDLTDLMLRLEEARKEASPAAERSSTVQLSEKDVALVEMFIARMNAPLLLTAD